MIKPLVNRVDTPQQSTFVTSIPSSLAKAIALLASTYLISPVSSTTGLLTNSLWCPSGVAAKPHAAIDRLSKHLKKKSSPPAPQAQG
ncbi:hypothetical protein BOTBODRAFT_52154 [Botryobasidium botryosum FD-172 SS1]|uniref:Uncharacterized protein n=1 Tax=Botryobasidium botryosum (strain FD-172 SS1) TaxID=930990 RepID=A0A067MTN9_BOTB1|nr:hypothetical protein BOTBODRAFT_52154 [Botryobasidium botryosum FD-172 SS1]